VIVQDKYRITAIRSAHDLAKDTVVYKLSTSTSTSAAGRTLADLPGPRPLPLVGNLFQIDRNQFHQTLERWAREYGPLFRLTVPGGAILVVADHELIAQVLRERPDSFRRPGLTARVIAEMGVHPSVFDAEGASWRNQRRMVMQAFGPRAIKAYFPSLVQVARRLERRWIEAAAEKRAIPLGDELRLYTVDIIAGLAFGADVNTIETGDNAIQRHLDQLLPGVVRRSFMPFPYWRYVKLPADRRLESSVAAINTAIAELIEQAKARLRGDPARADNPPNLLEAMLVAAAQEGSEVTEAEVAGNVSTMLLAGEDTTANGLTWLIWLLHRHPRILARAREEVLNLAPSLASLSLEQVEGLDFIDACIHEALRLKPPAVFLAAEALVDTVIGDVAVRKDTLILCAMRSSSLDDACYARAAQFDPERWLAAEVNKKASMPFGAGPRICPGRYLALLEMKVALVMLLARFDIESVDTRHGGEPRERAGFAMAPEALQMRLRLPEMT
jgi:cytochrome P450